MSKKKSNIGKKSRNTQQKAASLKKNNPDGVLKRPKEKEKFMDMSPESQEDALKEGSTEISTQELLKTQDTIPPTVDSGNTQKMLAALESEGNFHNHCYGTYFIVQHCS